MNNIKNFNQFILENVEQPLDAAAVAAAWAAIRRDILSLRGKSEDDIDKILPGFKLDDIEGDTQDRAYCDLVSPVDKKNFVHVVAKLEVENGKITVVSSMNDDYIKEWLKNKL